MEGDGDPMEARDHVFVSVLIAFAALGAVQTGRCTIRWGHALWRYAVRNFWVRSEPASEPEPLDSLDPQPEAALDPQPEAAALRPDGLPPPLDDDGPGAEEPPQPQPCFHCMTGTTLRCDLCAVRVCGACLVAHEEVHTALPDWRAEPQLPRATEPQHPRAAPPPPPAEPPRAAPPPPAQPPRAEPQPPQAAPEPEPEVRFPFMVQPPLYRPGSEWTEELFEARDALARLCEQGRFRCPVCRHLGLGNVEGSNQHRLRAKCSSCHTHLLARCIFELR